MNPGKIRIFAVLVLASGCASVAMSDPQRVPPTFTYARRYTPHASTRYELRLSYLPLGGIPYTQRTIMRHDETATSERISFEALARTTDGKTEDWSEVAKKFPGYDVSLSVAGDANLKLPNLTDLDKRLIEPITDIHTFLVAVSPHAGSDRVHNVGDRHAGVKPAIGQWAQAPALPVGEDCISIEVELRELTAKTATYVTTFSPPKEPCLTPAYPAMSKPVAEVPNNFQQIEVKEGMRDALWGHEGFVVTATVARDTGGILSADMDNVLDLKMRMGCSDEALENCKMELPVKLTRHLSLRRVGDKGLTHRSGSF